MAMTAPFAPLFAGTTGLGNSVTVAATTSSVTSAAFTGNTAQTNAMNQVRVANTTASFAYVTEWSIPDPPYLITHVMPPSVVVNMWAKSPTALP